MHGYKLPSKRRNSSTPSKRSGRAPNKNYEELMLKELEDIHEGKVEKVKISRSNEGEQIHGDVLNNQICAEPKKHLDLIRVVESGRKDLASLPIKESSRHSDRRHDGESQMRKKTAMSLEFESESESESDDDSGSDCGGAPHRKLNHDYRDRHSNEKGSTASGSDLHPKILECEPSNVPKRAFRDNRKASVEKRSSPNAQMQSGGKSDVDAQIWRDEELKTGQRRYAGEHQMQCGQLRGVDEKVTEPVFSEKVE